MARDEEALVQVYAAAHATEGYLVKGRLEAEGIPVLLKGESEGPYRMGPVYLWVPGGFEVHARLILEAFQTGGEESVPEPEELGNEGDRA